MGTKMVLNTLEYLWILEEDLLSCNYVKVAMEFQKPLGCHKN